MYSADGKSSLFRILDGTTSGWRRSKITRSSTLQCPIEMIAAAAFVVASAKPLNVNDIAIGIYIRVKQWGRPQLGHLKRVLGQLYFRRWYLYIFIVISVIVPLSHSAIMLRFHLPDSKDNIDINP